MQRSDEAFVGGCGKHGSPTHWGGITWRCLVPCSQQPWVPGVCLGCSLGCSIRSPSSLRFFPKFFFLYFLLFHIYFFSFSYGELMLHFFSFSYGELMLEQPRHGSGCVLACRLWCMGCG